MCVRELAFYLLIYLAVIAVRLFVLFLFFINCFSFLLHLQSVGFFFAYAFLSGFLFVFFLLFSLFFLVKACINIFVYKDITLRFAFGILHFALCNWGNIEAKE